VGRGLVGGAKPGYGWDVDALERYRQIILMAKERGMKVTLALRPQRHSLRKMPGTVAPDTLSRNAADEER